MTTEVDMSLSDPQFESVLHPQHIDRSINMEGYSQVRPFSQFQNTPLSKISQLQYQVTDNKFVNLNKSYIELAVQLFDSTTNAPYAVGAPVALDYGTPWFYKAALAMGGVEIETTTALHHKTMIVRSLTEPPASIVGQLERSPYESQLLIPDDVGQQQAIGALVTAAVVGTSPGVSYTPAQYVSQYLTPVLTGSTANPPVWTSGPILPNPLYNSGFWKRQALTDNGRVAYVRIPLSSLFGYAQLDTISFSREILITLSPLATAGYITHALNNGANPVVAYNDGYLQVVDTVLMVYSAIPSDEIRSQINQMILNRTSRKLSWMQYNTYRGTMAANVSSFTNTFTNISERPYWAIFHFIPDAWDGKQLYNNTFSTQPVDYVTGNVNYKTAPGGCNISSAYLQYGTQMVPATPYVGSLKSDLVRMHSVLLDVTDKRVYGDSLVTFDDMFITTPCIPNGVAVPTTVTSSSVPQLLGGAFLLAFDLRHCTPDVWNAKSPQTLILNVSFNNAIGANPYSVYMTVCSEKAMVLSGDGSYLSFTTS